MIDQDDWQLHDESGHQFNGDYWLGEVDGKWLLTVKDANSHLGWRDVGLFTSEAEAKEVAEND